MSSFTGTWQSNLLFILVSRERQQTSSAWSISPAPVTALSATFLRSRAMTVMVLIVTATISGSTMLIDTVTHARFSGRLKLAGGYSIKSKCDRAIPCDIHLPSFCDDLFVCVRADVSCNHTCNLVRFVTAKTMVRSITDITGKTADLMRFRVDK